MNHVKAIAFELDRLGLSKRKHPEGLQVKLEDQLVRMSNNCVSGCWEIKALLEYLKTCKKGFLAFGDNRRSGNIWQELDRLPPFERSEEVLEDGETF